ncbi:hypothetical protein IFM89_018273 [Coptis chinensis]|uniref:Uncharacterized protein n=1 Tax=Coptis chinensis TaxID=261450 RepID=A0A835ICK2_9MAGN|nr:hypothetical protein IFM89_018273 [Coptis chinensis]
MVIGILIGLRILCYAISRLLKRTQPESEQNPNEGLEMQSDTRNQRQQLAYQQRINMESKFVILAGDDQVTFLATPRPFEENILTALTLEKTAAVNESIELKHEMEPKKPISPSVFEVEELERKMDDCEEEPERRTSAKLGANRLRPSLFCRSCHPSLAGFDE